MDSVNSLILKCMTWLGYCCAELLHLLQKLRLEKQHRFVKFWQRIHSRSAYVDTYRSIVPNESESVGIRRVYFHQSRIPAIFMKWSGVYSAHRQSLLVCCSRTFIESVNFTYLKKLTFFHEHQKVHLLHYRAGRNIETVRLFRIWLANFYGSDVHNSNSNSAFSIIRYLQMMLQKHYAETLHISSCKFSLTVLSFFGYFAVDSIWI